MSPLDFSENQDSIPIFPTSNNIQVNELSHLHSRVISDNEISPLQLHNELSDSHPMEISATFQNPHSEEFDLTHSFFELENGENIVKFDGYLEDKRIIVSATDKTLGVMYKALALHLDG